MRFGSLALVLVAAGCYQIDADVSGLTASAGQESFDAAGPAAGQPLEIDRMLTFDGASGIVATLQKARIDTVTLTPASGVTSLDFLSSLTLVLHTDSGDVPLVSASGQMAAADGTVTLPINVDIDPALLGHSMQVASSIGFVAPAAAWSMSIDSTLTVQGHADLHP